MWKTSDGSARRSHRLVCTECEAVDHDPCPHATQVVDIVAVNKADGPGLQSALTTVAHYTGAMSFIARRHRHWAPKVLAVSAKTGYQVPLGLHSNRMIRSGATICAYCRFPGLQACLKSSGRSWGGKGPWSRVEPGSDRYVLTPISLH